VYSLLDVNTRSRLERVFRDVLDDDGLVLRPEMTAGDVENWDSISHIDLIVAIEREFRVRFTTAEVGGMKNVGELELLVEKKLPAAAK
jgi:acyl carrier protein